MAKFLLTVQNALKMEFHWQNNLMGLKRVQQEVFLKGMNAEIF